MSLTEHMKARTYAVSWRTSGQADVKLTACHLCLKREASSEPREAGTAAAGPEGSGRWTGTSFALRGLGRALANVAAQRSHQAYGQRRRPLGGGGGGRGGRGGLLWWDGEDMIRIRWCSEGWAALLEEGQRWVFLISVLSALELLCPGAITQAFYYFCPRLFRFSDFWSAWIAFLFEVFSCFTFFQVYPTHIAMHIGLHSPTSHPFSLYFGTWE